MVVGVTTLHKASNADALEIMKDGFALVCIINLTKCVSSANEHMFIIDMLFGMCH